MALTGSSPHVRGASTAPRAHRCPAGIIPACAGSIEVPRDRQQHGRDHPRMCGEHLFCSRSIWSAMGSSPHVRGAFARASRADPRAVDHPRMCGEHCPRRCTRTGMPGSSPHVRGAFLRIARHPATAGIIPACAGSICCNGDSTQYAGDHPRMCGEHTLWTKEQFVEKGSSPHVRGAFIDGALVEAPRGIIPACAGSILPSALPLPAPRDHPRMCGEHKLPVPVMQRRMGSSPHVRGASGSIEEARSCPRIIPACAGSILPSLTAFRIPRDHPRMCGEHDGINAGEPEAMGSSPHVRGAFRLPLLLGEHRGIIPACAGSIRWRQTSSRGRRDHPRMCGEHSNSPASLSDASRSYIHYL